MPTLYIISRDDCSLYYHSLTPRGYPLWIEEKEHAQLLEQQEAIDLVIFIQNSCGQHCSYEKETDDTNY